MRAALHRDTEADTAFDRLEERTPFQIAVAEHRASARARLEDELGEELTELLVAALLQRDDELPGDRRSDDAASPG
jgi:hypothetical protein